MCGSFWNLFKFWNEQNVGELTAEHFHRLKIAAKYSNSMRVVCDSDSSTKHYVWIWFGVFLWLFYSSFSSSSSSFRSSRCLLFKKRKKKTKNNIFSPSKVFNGVRILCNAKWVRQRISVENLVEKSPENYQTQVSAIIMAHSQAIITRSMGAGSNGVILSLRLLSAIHNSDWSLNAPIFSNWISAFRKCRENVVDNTCVTHKRNSNVWLIFVMLAEKWCLAALHPLAKVRKYREQSPHGVALSEEMLNEMKRPFWKTNFKLPFQP